MGTAFGTSVPVSSPELDVASERSVFDHGYLVK